MSTYRGICSLAAGFLFAVSTASAQQAAPPYTPAHDSLSVVSAALGESRPINVWTPPGYAASPSKRWPVLYMPDGGMNEDFPHIVHAVDSLIGAGKIRPVIVVGIPNTQRRRDLTGPTRVASDSAIAPRVGGSAAFRGFIQDELFPFIAARYRVTGERAIIGESLAGLFIVETLLEAPAMFTHYVALDPSLWWNRSALLGDAAARLRAARGRRTLFLATSNEPGINTPTEKLAALLRGSRSSALTWTYVPRPDLTHGTIFLATEAAGLMHALR